MNVSDLSMMTYAELIGFLGNKTERTLTNNTRVVYHRNQDIGIVHHWTEIITVHKDDTYTVDTHGYHTLSTMTRVRALSPVTPYSYRGVLKLSNGAEFVDGLTYDAYGNVIEKELNGD